MAGDGLSSLERAGGHGACEPVAALVGDPHRIVVVLERDDDQHGAEYLLLGDRHAVVDVDEHRRLDVVALRELLGPTTADAELRAFGDAFVDVARARGRAASRRRAGPS